MNTIKKTMMRSGRYMVPVDLEIVGDRIFIIFEYDKTLMDEVKKMEGRKWHGFDPVNPRKAWSIPCTPRNMFTLEYLCSRDGVGPYKKYKDPVKMHDFPKRLDHFKNVEISLKLHQVDLASQWLQKGSMVWGAEMRTGKTLAAFAAIEAFIDQDIRNGSVWDAQDIWWLGSNSSLGSTATEIERWRPGFEFTRMTYERVRIMKDAGEIVRYPRILVCDESGRIKTPTSQRSVAIRWLSEQMRNTHGQDNVRILCMTGTPAPKSPIDWWHQAEVACPGYLSESAVGLLHQRLRLINTSVSSSGGVFPKPVAWLDSEDVCSHKEERDLGYTDDNDKPIKTVTWCGKPKSHELHDWSKSSDAHTFVPSVNEVAKLYRRLSGLVAIKFKRECLPDLPLPTSEFISLPPTQSMQRAMKLVISTAPRAVTALTLCRELSDGFQYESKETGERVVCKLCNGKKSVSGLTIDDFGNPVADDSVGAIECELCDADGTVPVMERKATRVDTPKLKRLERDLEECEEVGRIVIYAGFTESIDRIVETCIANEWAVIRADGRGWVIYSPKGEVITAWSKADALKVFAKFHKDYDVERLAFVGHPDAAGEGIDLSAAWLIIWYSLPFSGMGYRQASERIFGPDMDKARGGVVRYYFHLSIDKYVFDNLQKKVRLEALSMGRVKAELAATIDV